MTLPVYQCQFCQRSIDLSKENAHQLNGDYACYECADKYDPYLSVEELPEYDGSMEDCCPPLPDDCFERD